MILTLHDPSRARQFYEQGLWRRDTLYSLLYKHAQECPDAYALRDSQHRLTWREFLTWVDVVAADFHEAMLAPGDRVSVWLPNRVETFIALLACSRNGYVCNTSLHQNYTVAEIIELLKGIHASALITQQGYGSNGKGHDVFALAEGSPTIKRVYQCVPRQKGLETMQGAEFPIPKGRATIDVPTIDNPDKITYLAFTSGTTGKPKGVMHSDNTLLANGRAMAKDWHLNANAIILSLSPNSHHISTVGLEQSLVAGCELVLNDPPPGVTTLDWMIECGATYVLGVPTHAIDIQAAMKQRNLNRLGNVKVFYMAGAPIPEETARVFLDQGIMPQKVYGMTENGSHQYTLPDDARDIIVRTCGRSCEVYQIKIFDQENPDQEVSSGTVGELGGQGAMLMLGYFDNQSATENSFNRDGYLMSGDLGWLDARGNFHFVGRKKDLIIRGGHNIYPAKIEDLAHRYAQVQKAAAFPVPDDRLGEKVCLAVLTRDGAKLDPYALLDHLYQSGLSKFDMPEYFIQLDSLPLTASGKVLKRELVDLAKRKEIQPLPIRWVDPMKAKEA